MKCEGSGQMAMTLFLQSTVACPVCGLTVECSPVMGVMASHEAREADDRLVSSLGESARAADATVPVAAGVGSTMLFADDLRAMLER